MTTLVLSSMELQPGANSITFGGDVAGFSSDAGRAYLHRSHLEGEEIETYTTLDYLVLTQGGGYDTDLWEPQYFGGNLIVLTSAGSPKGEQFQLGKNDDVPADLGKSTALSEEELKERPARKSNTHHQSGKTATATATATTGSTEKR